MRKLVILIIVMALFSACNRVQTGNPESDAALVGFNDIVNQNKDRKGYHDALKHWGLSLPGGDKFEWIKDTAANKADFAMVILAEPFINAGLDVSKLKDTPYIFEPSIMEDGKQLPDRLLYVYNVSDKSEVAQGSDDAMRRILKQQPSLVKYHKELQHYMLLLAGGFEVQWTEKLGLNDADMVFYIESDPLTAAGVDISKLDTSGWIYKEGSTDGMYSGETHNRFAKIYKLAK